MFILILLELCCKTTSCRKLMKGFDSIYLAQLNCLTDSVILMTWLSITAVILVMTTKHQV